MNAMQTIKADWLDWPQTRQLVAAFALQPESLRFVGGAVRDSILGRKVHDVDAATSLLPQKVLSLLEAAKIKAIPTGLVHGTVTAIIDGKQFEITTLRNDVACDGRHAQVAYTTSWEEDAKRRDFTMNALYLSPSGELFDYAGGAEDAKAGQVRFIGDASQRIEEDRLRILRFFRFYAYYGSGKADEVALAACAAAAQNIPALSGERLQKEMLKILDAPMAAHCINLMQKTGVLPQVLGFSVGDLSAFERLQAIEAQNGMALLAAVKLALFQRGAAIGEQQAVALMIERLRLSNIQARILEAIAQHGNAVTPALDEAGQKRLVRIFGQDLCCYILLVNWACDASVAADDKIYHNMLSLFMRWEAPGFPLTGQDLLAIGVAPGKHMGELLRSLENWWEEKQYLPTREELLVRAKQQV